LALSAGIHAREWISPATVTYIINELVNNYDANKEVADAYDWYILPVHNPDGYEYTYTNVSWVNCKSLIFFL
jgi:murein tripeptide amidase MpaA